MQNVVIDSQGYPKLVDFGFAKRLPSVGRAFGRTFTPCGSPDYVSPEMLAERGVGQPADLWSFGVVAYEILSGQLPFTDPSGDEQVTLQNIRSCKWRWPSPEARDALDDTAKARRCAGELLVTDPTRRLGGGERGALEVMDHPWFDGFDWAALLNKAMRPPWIPRLRGADDVHYFADSDPTASGPDDPPITDETQREIERYDAVWAAFRQ